MVDKNMQKKIRDFVEKYNRQGFTPRDPSMPTHKLFLGEIADAVSEFEEAEAKYSNEIDSWNYQHTLENLNKLINENNSHFYLLDSEILREIKDLREKYSELERERDLNKNLLDKCRQERDQFKQKLESCTENFKQVFGDKTQDGDVIGK